MSAQLQFPPRVIKRDASAPLMSLNAVMGKLELAEDEVMELIEGVPQRLAWAWDIGTSTRRREVRVLARCVQGYFTTTESCGLANANAADISQHILARDKKPWITIARLAVLLVCSKTLLMNLLDDKQLAVLPGTNWRRGPNGSAQVTRESVLQFLAARRIK